MASQQETQRPWTRNAARRRGSDLLGKFLVMEELVHILVSYLDGRRDLTHLCRTCKALRAIFTPFLYASVSYDKNWKLFSELLAEESGRPLTATRALSVNASYSIRDVQPWGYDPTPLPTHQKDDAIQLISRMPNLRRLTLVDIPIDPSMLNSFKTLGTHLEKLTIVYPFDDAEWEGHDIRELGTATQWNLTSLILKDLPLMMGRWCNSIAKILISSPDLEELGIDFQWIPAITPGSSPQVGQQFSINHVFSFLKDLSDLFATEGGRPLRIRRLHIGNGVELSTHASKGSPARADYISQLLDLACLEEVVLNPHGPQYRSSRVAWQTFSGQTTPRLRRLTTNTMFLEDARVTTRSCPMRDWICASAPHFIEQLAIITVWTGGFGDYPTRFGHLPYHPLPFPSCPRMMSLDIPASSEPHLEPNMMSTLDGLDQYPNLEGLFLSFIGVQPRENYFLPQAVIDKLAISLALMPNLEQLLIHVPIRATPELRHPRPWMTKFAKQLLEISSVRLRYMAVGSSSVVPTDRNVYKFAWHVTRPSSDKTAGPLLTPLTAKEVWDVELLRASAAALPSDMATQVEVGEGLHEIRW